MLEFVVVGPIITLLGLSAIQYGMLFFAKNQLNHASFMAARAGSAGNAQISTAREAYAKALIPLYGGGTTPAELAQAYEKALADTGANVQIALLNPTKESFDDWNDPALQAKYGVRAIPNSGQFAKNASEIKPASGQNIQDANLLKLRITHGYEPKVPFVGKIYTQYLKALDPGTDAFHTQLVNAGRIPVVTSVTLEMQSDALEGNNVSSPGSGNNGNPTNPGDPPVTDPDPPPCSGCDNSNSPGGGTDDTGGSDDSGDSGDSGGPCPAPGTTYTLPGDVFFAFNQATLTDAGKAELDKLIAQAKDQSFTSVTLTGYTDQLGSTSYNQQLSFNRAAAVRDYLKAKGFPDKPITVQGLGAQNPVVDLASCPASGQAQIDCLAPNRRVEVRLAGGS